MMGESSPKRTGIPKDGAQMEQKDDGAKKMKNESAITGDERNRAADNLKSADMAVKVEKGEGQRATCGIKRQRTVDEEIQAEKTDEGKMMRVDDMTGAGCC